MPIGIEGLPTTKKEPGFFSGAPAQTTKIPQMTAESMQLLKFLAPYIQQQLGQPLQSKQQLGAQQMALGKGMEFLQKPIGFDFGPIEAQAQRQFEEQTIPTLAERFTSLAGEGRSSAFPQLIGAAGTGLQENLAALKAQIGMQQDVQRQNLGQYFMGLGMQPNLEKQFAGGLLGSAFQSPYQAMYHPAEPSTLSSLLGAGAGAAGQGAGIAGGAWLLKKLAPLLGLIA